MKKQTVKKGMSTGAKIGIGATVAAAGVAAYLLLGPDGKKNRKKVSAWTDKMEKEVIKKVKSAKALSEATYHDLIDDVLAKYKTIQGVNKKELIALASELRNHWKAISNSAKPKKVVKKVVKAKVKSALKPKKATKATSKQKAKK